MFMENEFSILNNFIYKFELYSYLQWYKRYNNIYLYLIIKILLVEKNIEV